MKTRAYINEQGKLVVEYLIDGNVWFSAIEDDPDTLPWQQLMVDDIRLQLQTKTIDEVI